MTVVFKPNLNTQYWVDAHSYQTDSVNKAIEYFKENPQNHMFNYELALNHHLYKSHTNRRQLRKCY